MCYNRISQTRLTLSSINDAEPRRLFVVQDGPKDSNDFLKCEEVRKLITETVDWDCEISWKIRDTNAGCRKNVSEGITWFFSEVDEGIVVEDDCVPNISFFKFCDELLERYRYDNDICCISGHPGFNFNIKDNSYLFSLFNNCWGWASWKDAWDYYDNDLSLISINSLNKKFGEYGFSFSEKMYWFRIYALLKIGNIDSWAYVWLLTAFNYGLLTCMPPRNIVSNVGFGEGSTHTRTGENDSLELACLDFPLLHPYSIKHNCHFDKQLMKISLQICFKGLVKNLLMDLYKK